MARLIGKNAEPRQIVRCMTRLRDARLRAGLTQCEAAERAGFSSAMWSYIESQGKGISDWSLNLEKWNRIAKAVGTTVESLMEDSPLDYNDPPTPRQIRAAALAR